MAKRQKSEQEVITEHRRKMGSVGGKATLKRHGKEHFKKLAQKRWSKKK